MLSITDGLRHVIRSTGVVTCRDFLSSYVMEEDTISLEEATSPVISPTPKTRKALAAKPAAQPVVVNVASGIDNPMPHVQRIPVVGGRMAVRADDHYVLVLVGLPASGKSFLARKLRNYLAFFHGVQVRSFNVGEYRRAGIGYFQKAEFFDPTNADAVAARKACSAEALSDLKAWIAGGEPVVLPGHSRNRSAIVEEESAFASAGFGSRSAEVYNGDTPSDDPSAHPTFRSGVRFAVFDATNGTQARRQWVLDELADSNLIPHHIIFIETLVKDPVMVEANIKTGASRPDYASMEPTAALVDYARRVELYRTTYESLSEEDESQLSWMRLTDGGRSTCMNRLHGYLPGKIMQFLSSLHTMPRNLYMTRHGQSEYNVLRKVGGDAGLSPLGEEYAVGLAKFVRDVVVEEDSHAR